MFTSPTWLMAAIPALLLAWGLLAWANSRRRAISAAWGLEQTFARISEDGATRRRWAAALRLSALAMIILSLAGPRWGVELFETRTSSRQVVVAIDLSLSMRATDVKPSRLERAKTALSLLLSQLQGDRVGVIAFAGDAQVFCPLTADVEAAKEILSGLEVGEIPVPGTAIGIAIRLAGAMIGRYPGQKSVVLLTDGEDHGTDPVAAAREAGASGARLYTVGIGTPEGEPIPLETGGYKKNREGTTVISRLGESVLAEAAQATGGSYYRSSPGGDEITDIVAKIKNADPVRGLSGSAMRWRNRYAWPLTLAFFLLLAEMGLPLLMPLRSPAAVVSVLILLMISSATPTRAAFGDATLRDANREYEEGNFEQSLPLYGQASGQKPNDPRPVFNAGNALYRLDRTSDAAGAFASIADRRDASPPLKSAALYNLGNSLYRNGDYAGAADAYRRTLSLQPEDPDARRNLVVALNRMKVPPKKKKEKKNDQQKNPPPKDQDQKQNGGGNSAGQSQPRPQDTMSREDADRVMRAVAEREKSARQQAAQSPAYGHKPKPPVSSKEDW